MIGTDLGSYGKDLGTDLIILLKEITRIKGDYTIKIRNLHPRFLIHNIGRFKDILKTGKISFISSSVESGSNRILDLMKRGYTIEEFKKTVSCLHTEFPELEIRTQIMIGFPGETDKDFHDSLKLLDEISFEFTEIFLFEPRPGTLAFEMTDRVSGDVIRKRFDVLYIKAFFHEIKRKLRQKRKAAVHA